MVHTGVKGVVKDEHGEGIADAMVKVKDNDKYVQTTRTGEYWKLLTPGNYTIVWYLHSLNIVNLLCKGCLCKEL